MDRLWIMKKQSLIPEINMEEYNYVLPTKNIAFEPSQERDGSRLLVYKNNNIAHASYTELASFLPQNAHLFFNNTRVIAARLKFKKKTGGSIEIFLLEPENGNYESLHQYGNTKWKCLVGGSKKWKHDETLFLDTNSAFLDIQLAANLLEKKEEHFVIEFSWQTKLTFSELLANAGLVPLPPYIKRENKEEDKTRYQTVYAKEEGSVAAPTAGLHFTENIFTSLDKKGIGKSFVTLHVGAGTFKPVSTSTIAEHQMHEEYFEVDIETIATLADVNKMVVAVGTTSLRTLESLYWIGLEMMQGEITMDLHALQLGQWDYLQWNEKEQLISTSVFGFLYQEMQRKDVTKLNGHTGICITPAYSLKVARALITNFHQPQSTLLLLIASIVGNRWKEIYAEAIANDYRFLSYGDGSILFVDQD